MLQWPPLESHGPEVDEIIRELVGGIEVAVGRSLVGFYLTGSLTYGDFEPGSSDIDYLVVLRSTLDPPQRRLLADAHQVIANRYPVWRDRIEGSFVTLDMLPELDPPGPRPYINQGAFWNPDPAYGNEWLVNRYALQECGLALSGPPFNDLVPPVSVIDVRNASAADLFTDWLPQVDDPDFLPDSHHEAYVTLTMCRILHRAFNDEVVSKRVAARWVQSRVGPEWQTLIERALQWQHGELLGERDTIRQFMVLIAEMMVLFDPLWTHEQEPGTD